MGYSKKEILESRKRSLEALKHRIQSESKADNIPLYEVEKKYAPLIKFYKEEIEKMETNDNDATEKEDLTKMELMNKHLQDSMKTLELMGLVLDSNTYLGRDVWVRTSNGEQIKGKVLKETGERVYVVNPHNGQTAWRFKREVEFVKDNDATENGALEGNIGKNKEIEKMPLEKDPVQAQDSKFKVLYYTGKDLPSSKLKEEFLSAENSEKVKEILRKKDPNIWRWVEIRQVHDSIDNQKETKDGYSFGDPKDVILAQDSNEILKLSGFTMDDENWITMNGTHVKIEEGQSKESAAKNFIKKKEVIQLLLNLNNPKPNFLLSNLNRLNILKKNLN